MRRTEEGTFQPNRENDELTYALGNAEHTGRTQGVGVLKLYLQAKLFKKITQKHFHDLSSA